MMSKNVADQTNGLSPGAHGSRRTLIKCIRSLDQVDLGHDGQSIQNLWKSLAQQGHNTYYAAEESALRWLLKSMKTDTDTSDALRRFPLSWRILDCAFQRIPLFSLAKSLADRKFIMILQQTLRTLAKAGDAPSKNAEVGLGKRKRPSTGTSFELSTLKTHEGCVATGDALMGALRTLLGRLDESPQSPNDRMGAEHIRALFSQQASDVATNLAPILSLCDTSLNLDNDLSPSSRESWINTMASIWDLRLQGSTDAIDVATFLTRPAFLLLAKISVTPEDNDAISHSIMAAWTRHLEEFLHRNLMLPAKSAFFNREDLEPLERCLDTNAMAASSTLPIFFHLAVTTPCLLEGLHLAKSEDRWTQMVFGLAVEACRKVDGANRIPILTNIMEEAIRNESSLSVDDLRKVCQRDALSPAPDWRLLSLIARCDPDTFLLTDDGIQLLEHVSEQLLAPVTDAIYTKDFLASLVRGYEEAHDLSTFLKRWYQCLSQRDSAVHNLDKGRPAWYAASLREDGQLIMAIRKTMSNTQILDLIDWLEAQPVRHPAASLVLLDTIASSLSPTFGADAIGLRLFNLSGEVSSPDVPHDLRPLRWRIALRSIAWVEPVQAEEMWNSASAVLTLLLEEGRLEDPETFQGFRLASELWEFSFPDSTQEPTLAHLLTMFSERLVTAMKRTDASKALWNPRALQTKTARPDPIEIAEQGLALYIDHCLGISSRLIPLLASRDMNMPRFLKAVSSMPRKKDSHGSAQVESSFGALFANENVVNNHKLAGRALDYVMDILEKSSKSSPWSNMRGVTALRTLASIDLDIFSRSQRERLMRLLHDQRRSLQKPEKVSVPTWNLVIGLMIKIAKRPNFYPEMHFNDLLDLASTVSIASTDTSEVSGLFQLIKDLSERTAQQMVDHYDEWGQKYFTGAAQAATRESATADTMAPLMVAPLCALISVSSGSTFFQAPDAPFNSRQVEMGIARSLEAVLTSLVHHGLAEPSVILHLICQLEASAFLPMETVRDHVKVSASELEHASLLMIATGNIVGWMLRIFLMRNFSQQLVHPRPTNFPGFSSLNAGNTVAFSCRILRACMNAAVTQLDAPSKLEYVNDLIKEFDSSGYDNARLLAIRVVVENLSDHSLSEPAYQGYFSAVHTNLAQLLVKTPDTNQLCHTAEILHMLSDQKTSSMTQWNVESTLSSVSAICSGKAGVGNRLTSAVFIALCSLTSVVIRRHRLRLDDHYHILLTALEALLRTLLSSATRSAPLHTLHVKHAVVYSRLITLITEPSAASVSRAQYAGSLDSTTDATKRIAGRHVYLLLLQYVKLQLEMDISREMREALEPAIFSILDVTPADVRKILNDALDGSGRAILRDIFKRYTQFGRWSGV